MRYVLYHAHNWAGGKGVLRASIFQALCRLKQHSFAPPRPRRYTFHPQLSFWKIFPKYGHSLPTTMRYWWVNQNQTYRHELGGGYLWSPKRNANGARNPFYESMREVAPGDLVFSFVDTRIAAIGIAESYCYESPKPEEFGGAGHELGGDWLAAYGCGSRTWKIASGRRSI